MRFLLSLPLLALLARIPDAQVPDSAQSGPGATISGVVIDSLVLAPVAGATVQLVAAQDVAGAARSTSSDSAGAFALRDVPDGRYLLGFFHPILDSLGIDPPLREVRIDRGRPVRADLFIPSASRLSTAVCGASGGAGLGAVILGVVRDAVHRTPLAGATVTAEWFELSIDREGFSLDTARRNATTGGNGWFALCQVPSPGEITLHAARAADTTDRIEVQVPVEGFVRRELYVGASRKVDQGRAVPRLDSVGAPIEARRTGDGRLSGRVIVAGESRPLAGAVVSIPNGPYTLTNEQGEWALQGVPLGTRILEIRALGYYPHRRPVDVVAGAAPIVATLSTMRSMLDTVHVLARLRERSLSGFTARSQTGAGRYFTAADIELRKPIVTSDMFHMVPGLRVSRGQLGNEVSMRGMFAGQCSPAIFLNGMYMALFTGGDIDEWVQPDEVAGIEIYTPGTVPTQFQHGMNNCGSIVIWLKPPSLMPDRGSLGWRIVKVLGVTAIGVALGALIR